MNNFDGDAVARIVQRAVELDSDRLDVVHGDRTGIDRRSLVLAATEVGIDASAIQTAIAEYDIGPGPRPARLDAILGPRHPTASRRIAARSDRVDAAIVEWLTRVNFQPIRRDRHHSIWDRRTDLAARTQRVAASAVGGERLHLTRRIDVRVVPIDETSSLVQVSSDRTTARTGALAATLGLLGAGATAVVAGVVVVPALGVNAVLCAAAAAGVAVVTRRRTERATTDLERLLDRLAADERPNLLGRVKAASRRADLLPPFRAPGSTA